MKTCRRAGGSRRGLASPAPVRRAERSGPGLGATSGTTIAGGNGPGSAANQLRSPQGVVVDSRGIVYVRSHEEMASFPRNSSTFGSLVDMVAPGVNILTADRNEMVNWIEQVEPVVETPLLAGEVIPELHIEPIASDLRSPDKWWLQASPELHMKRLLALCHAGAGAGLAQQDDQHRHWLRVRRIADGATLPGAGICFGQSETDVLRAGSAVSCRCGKVAVALDAA